jgi:hypothetical protein
MGCTLHHLGSGQLSQYQPLDSIWEVCVHHVSMRPGAVAHGVSHHNAHASTTTLEHVKQLGKAHMAAMCWVAAHLRTMPEAQDLAKQGCSSQDNYEGDTLAPIGDVVGIHSTP